MGEYTVAQKHWSLTGTDIAEIMRNSVLQSGFTHKEKKQFISDKYLLGGVAGNDEDKTDIPNRRAAFRHGAHLEELYWVQMKSQSAKRKSENGAAEYELKQLVAKGAPWRWMPSTVTQFLVTKDASKQEKMWPKLWWDLTEFSVSHGKLVSSAEAQVTTKTTRTRELTAAPTQRKTLAELSLESQGRNRHGAAKTQRDKTADRRRHVE